MTAPPLLAPFPYFGGKRTVAAEVWQRLGKPKQYIEPFCGSAAVLLAAPAPALLEVVGDTNGFIANFWRATIAQPAEVSRWADYPVSHIDLGARHRWLMDQRERVAEALLDALWPGDAQVAGWWLWGQCCWIGSGWCEWSAPRQRGQGDKIPHIGDAGRGIQATGQIPHLSDAGMGIQATGKIPHLSDAGMGIASRTAPTRAGARTSAARVAAWTSSGAAAWTWLHRLAARLERVRVVHGDWSRCLNHHYGASDTAVFLDPPYESYEGVYRASPVATSVAAWCQENAGLRIALCGHVGDHDLPGWEVFRWERERPTYGSDTTRADECIWFSPPCAPRGGQQAWSFATRGER